MWTPEDTYAIARIDLPDASTHGWQVRVQRRGRKYAKYFADRPCGGVRASYRAALDWRNDLLSRLEQEVRTSTRICQRSTRNSSGVVGVSKVAVSSSNGETYLFWQATWSPEPGQRRCVKFSVKRHGDRQAFRLAVEARRKGIGTE
ncbi:hypothetical protein HNR46_000776 [Haloferula luteola]|uniref:AP2 domain-containing protein n=1 Tax=Haloferula luteola TaxID=595692 RepID=A0A840V723_9BACT|nr:AP2 domain-containing protein [Haloferula luteola]MBB5350548.1 hypothetical protein [Haloferula luteola]